jgi:hypothetical protein
MPFVFCFVEVEWLSVVKGLNERRLVRVQYSHRDWGCPQARSSGISVHIFVLRHWLEDVGRWYVVIGVVTTRFEREKKR